MITAQVKRTLLRRALVNRGQHVLAACSGGPDSVAMTHVLFRLSDQLGFTIVVASIDHGLRAEATTEVERVRELADRWSLPFRTTRLDLSGGGDLQSRARTERYRALVSIATQEGAHRIAVGHTRDDQAETVLDRILRGAGLRGLAGIHPEREDGVIRPLLDCGRDEVFAHLRHHGLTWSEDPSNQDHVFRRVRIRNRVLPALVQEDLAVARHLAELADDARDAYAACEIAAAELVPEATESLSASSLRTVPRAVRRAAIRRWARQMLQVSLRRTHVEAIDDLLEASGTVLLGNGWAVVLDEGFLVVRPEVGAAPTTPRNSEKTSPRED